jgi:riboflavin kinase/FMN adenylyltransferase
VSGPLATNEQRVALTIGVFDGVHRGHQDLIRRMVTAAKRDNVGSVSVTFDPDPEVVLRPEHRHLALSTMEERTAQLISLGVDHVEIVPFTPAVASQSPEEFIDGLCASYRLQSLWVAADFALGRGRTGTVERLRGIGRDHGFEVTAVDLLAKDGRPISATWIREALALGDVRLAADLLGRPYCLAGRVAPGAQRGRTLGFPTANIVPPPGRALPADGVYFVQVSGPGIEAARQNVGGRPLPCGVVNLGGRPTFDETERLLETHILDFEGELYESQLEVCFLEQLRGIQRFSSVDELREAIQRDVAAARQLLRASSPSASSSH